MTVLLDYFRYRPLYTNMVKVRSSGSEKPLRIDKGSPVPLYYQLADWIRDQILIGAFDEGDKLPSEIVLSSQAGVSRMTARQAVSYLAREGLLEVRPGVGTFVAGPKLTHDALNLLGFTEEMMRQGGSVSSRVLEQRVLECPPRVAMQLELPNGEPAVQIVRLRLVDDTPLLLETSIIPETLCPGLQYEDLAEKSLYELMARKYGLHLQRARHTFEARTTGEWEREMLAMDAGTSVIVLEGVTYTHNDRPAEHCEAVYRGDRFSFVVDSYGGSRAGAGPPQVSGILIGKNTSRASEASE
jgi:GntR family transcriptional regulator